MYIGMILDKNYTNDKRVRREAETLVKNGHKVFVLTIRRGDSESEIISGVKIIRIAVSKFLIDKFRGMTPYIPIYNLIWKNKISNFINKYNINVLHVHDLPLIPLTIKIGWKHHIPVVGDFHENYAEAMKLYYWTNTLKGKIFINLKKWDEYQAWAVKNLDKIIVVANETVDYFSQKYEVSKEKFAVVDNSIDIEQFDSGSKKRDLEKELKLRYHNYIVLGFTGVLIPNRGLIHLIKVLPKFKNEKIKFAIAGRGIYQKILKNEIEKRGIQEMVDWYDWIPFDDLITFTSCFDIGITRLEQNLQNDYTTPNKVFQYMYLGIPVLTADSKPMLRIVGETESGHVFKSGDYKDLENKLRLLIEDKKLREKIGNNGKKAVQSKYNWNITKKNLIKLYNELR